MAEHMIETRILLRYDTLSNWMSSNVILKPGEAAIAASPINYTIEQTNSRPDNTPPAIGIKVGDGYHYFRELPWVQAVAGDVYNWAKQQNKPSYAANEIQGLTTLIQQCINEAMGGGGGDVTIEARAYRLIKGTGADVNKYFLQSRGANDVDWVTDQLNYIDLTTLADILAWIQPAYDEYWTLNGYTLDKIATRLSQLTYTDNEDASKVVTAVDQTNGLISVTRRALLLSALSGTLSVEKGGTGRAELEQDSVLVGNGTSAVKLVPIDTELENNTNLATNRAIKNYIDNATAGLTGAMHYVGDATVEIRNGSSTNPRINGYNFSQVQYGDVITFDTKEFVWEGGWRLLGDEGSYAVKGSIMNADIADEANISQSKIAGLQDSLSNKVDKVEGKQLSTNDFSTEYKNKLDNIEDNAQRNLIEHIYINGTEATPTTIDGKENSLSIRLSSLTPEEEEKLRGIENNAQVNAIEHIFLNEVELGIGTVKSLGKSVNIELVEFTEQEKLKLSEIEAGAQVNTIQSITVNGAAVAPSADKVVDITIPNHAEHENKIEKIYLNGVEQTPVDKEVNLQIDESAVTFTVLKGARVPTGIVATPYEDVDIDNTTKKLELARIAKTGSIYDVQNTAANNTTDYLILNCGSSTTLLD